MKTEKIQEQRYWGNLVAGIGLGLVLLMAYYVAGRGLGGSGAYTRLTAAFLHLFAPEHIEGLPSFARYFKDGSVLLNDWLLFLMFGVFLGGFIGAVTAGRFGKTIDKGKNITGNQRFFYAVVGGMIMGWGARMARGCTSGQGLNGAATLAAGSWVLMLSMFVAGFITGIFSRRLWL